MSQPTGIARRGIMLVVSSRSGAGKTTLIIPRLSPWRAV